MEATPALRLLARAGGRLADLLLPPRCGACGEVVASADAVCVGCFNRLSFINGAGCPCCGLPLDQPPGLAALVCGGCAEEPPAFRRARAALVYDDGSRGLITAFKHADRTELAPLLARWMMAAAPSLLEAADVLVPVPLHPGRLRRRRYNQAALLAHRLGTLTGLPVAALVLRRQRPTPSQGGLGRQARAENIKGAFVARPHPLIMGRSVLLIDDVLTTGATAGACAQALRKAGATAVDVLTIARVPE